MVTSRIRNHHGGLRYHLHEALRWILEPPSVLTFVFWGIAFTIFIFALKTFDLSFAYAVWVGSGIVIVSLIGILYLRTHKCLEDLFNSPDCDYALPASV